MKGGEIMGIKSTSDIFFILSVTAVFMAVFSWALSRKRLAGCDAMAFDRDHGRRLGTVFATSRHA